MNFRQPRLHSPPVPKLHLKTPLPELDSASLGIGMTGDGLDAIRWWHEGKLLEIAEYCCFDVKCMQFVHKSGIAHKKLHYTDRFQQRKSVPVAG